MSLLTKPENSTTATTPLRKPDSLRIRQSDGDAARVVALSAGKTTIGSSPQCTIVLPASECRPLQCVITLDARSAEATRWGAGVQLNHRDFSKSIVGVGDKLNIGGCELEFIAAEILAPRDAASEPRQPVVAEAVKSAAPSAVKQDVAKQEEAAAVEPAASKPVSAAPVAAASSAPVRTEVKLLAAPPAGEPVVEPVAEPVVAAPAAETLVAKEKSPAPEPAAEAPIAVQPASPAKSLTVPVVSAPTLVALAAPPTPAAPATPAQSTPVAAEISPAPAVPAAAEPIHTSSHQFADELILQLWRQSDSSRRRAHSLVAATRDARLRTDAMGADLAAMEVELDLARAAYDSHAANHEQLHLELIERDRQAAERLAPLVNEVESLRSQLQESQIELAEQAARCDELSAAIEVQAADKSHAEAEAEARLAATQRAAEFEQSLAVQIEQATLLARELGTVRTELDSLRSELASRVSQHQELAAELAAAKAEQETLQNSADQLADCEATIDHLRGEVGGLHAEREQLHGKLADAEGELHRLAEMYLAHTAAQNGGGLAEQAEQAADHASETAEPAEVVDHFAAVEPAAFAESAESAPSAEVAETSADEPHAFSGEDGFAALVHDPGVDEPVADEPVEHHDWATVAPLDVEPQAELHAEIEPTPAMFAPLAPFPLVVEPTPAPAAEEVEESHEAAVYARPQELKTVPVESETSASSFIDKYRHLLDDEPNEPAAPAFASPLAASRPVLDDEYLSPAKAAERTAHADDSDEALEAYMANMMARMRGVSASSMVEPAPIHPVVEQPVVEETTTTYDPSEPFDIESMKQGRRAPISTDLAALREIANTSARTAIATHRNKRKVESAIGKIIIAIAAFGASGFLMSSAPALASWQFPVGVAVGIIGMGAAILAVRGRVDAEHFLESQPRYVMPEDAAGDA